ncbi:MAG: adenine phosphoribosyltransferase [Myxococcales bacterium]|nr:adenine phosphoribosyltransferase [Myxococcales bacterium]
MPIKSRIRTVPDYPKPGVQFRDITPLLEDPIGLRLAVEGLAAPYKGMEVDKVAGIEARGFILGSAVAVSLEAGFVLVRKAGKLPGETIGHDYDLEYGTDRVEIHKDAIKKGERVLLIDDLIATGGTASAAVQVIEQCGGEIVGVGVVIDLPDLGGSKRIEAHGLKVTSLCSFEGE